MALIVAVIVKQIFSDYIVTSNSSSHMSLALEAESKLPFLVNSRYNIDDLDVLKRKWRNVPPKCPKDQKNSGSSWLSLSFHPLCLLLFSLSFLLFFFLAVMNQRFWLFYVTGKHNGFIHKQIKFCRTKHATKAHKGHRIPEQNLPHALGSWSSGFWVWRSWTRWSDGRGVPFAAWETGGRWEQQRVRQRQGEVGEADGGMLKGT